MRIQRRKLLALSAAALATPHIARAAPRKLRAGHNNSPTSALQAACIVFQSYVAEKSEGRYAIEVFPSSQLGNDLQLARAVSDGTVDMTISATSLLGTFHRDLELVEIPYLFQGPAAARKALAGDLGAYYADLLAKSSLTVIGWGENGLRHVTANKPVRTPDDLKGVKIRVQASRIQVESFLGLGAAAAPMTFTELPEALRTGRFDAQENPVSIIVSNDFIPRYQSHVSLTGHIYSPFVVSFSSDVLEDMSPADRAIMKAAGPLAAKATIEFNENAVATGLGKLKAAGMTIVTDVDRPAFQRAMEAVGPRLAAVAGADAIARVRGLIA